MDPAIKKSVWTEDEEKLLKLYHGQYGNKWTRLSELIPGRRYAFTILGLNSLSLTYSYLVKMI